MPSLGNLVVTRRRFFDFALAALCLALTSAFACEIRVRDSAFRTVRDVHKLCVIADSSDDSGSVIEQRLNQWLDTLDDSFNVEIVRIDADDPQTNWRSVGIPTAPPSLPVTVLVGRDNGIGQSFVIEHWEPAPTDDQLLSIQDSPVRRQLARELAGNVAVLVFAPTSDGAGSRAEMVASIAEAGVTGERIGLSMITLDRDDPAERLLCRFMGIRPDSPDTLCVAFGRGKLMSPPLMGDEINSANVGNLVTQIRQACSCSKPLATMGVDVPLVWSEAIDSRVVLMDAELDLSELDTEVQNMLAAKATSAVVGDPTLLQIAPGREQAAALPSASMSTRNRFTGLGIAAAVCVIAIAIVLSRRRSSSAETEN